MEKKISGAFGNKLAKSRMIDQIVLVNQDVEQMTSLLTEYFGYTGWNYEDTLLGKKGWVRLSNGIELCIVQPSGQESVYLQSLRTYGNGIMGIRERIRPQEAAVWREHIQEKNIPVWEISLDEFWLDLREQIGGMYGLFISEEEIKAGDSDKTIGQICITAGDVHRIAEHMVEFVGMGPWEIGFINNTTSKYFNSADYDQEHFPKGEMMAGMGWYANLEMELIQPTKGPMPYFKFLERHGNGFHHIKETVKKGQWENTIRHCCQEKKIPVALGGQVGPCEFCNLDTLEEFGFVYELGDGNPMDRLPDGYNPYMYPELTGGIF